MISKFEAKIIDFSQADYTKQYSLLECAIREKIDKKQNPKSKKQSLAGYILLYRALAKLYPEEQIKITYNEHGKPLCDFCFFNISHSDDRVICVVSDQPVGVDIQKFKKVKPKEKYKFFNDKECDYVNQNEDLICERFIEIFTKKEAAIKMLGLSMSYASRIDTFSTEFCFEIIRKDDFLSCVCLESKKIM